MNLLKKLQVFTKSFNSKFGSVTIDDEQGTELFYEGEVLEEGMPIFVMTEEGAEMPAPEGSHKLEDGRTVVVNAEGLVDSITEGEESAEVEEEMSTETEEEFSKKFNKAAEPFFKEMMAFCKARVLELYSAEDRLKELKGSFETFQNATNETIENLKKENETLKEGLEKIGNESDEEPKTRKFNHHSNLPVNPIQKSLLKDLHNKTNK